MHGKITKNFLTAWAMTYGTQWVEWNEAIKFKQAFLENYPECSNIFHIREHILPRGYMDVKRNSRHFQEQVRLNKEKYDGIS